MNKYKKMKCKTIHNKIIFFVEGSLPTNKSILIEEHLQECKECLAFAEELKKSLAIIQTEKIKESDPFFYTRLKARMVNQLEKGTSKIPYFIRFLQPVAFSLLLMVGIYSGIKIGKTPQSNSAEMVSEIEMIPFLNEMDGEPIESFLMN